MFPVKPTNKRRPTASRKAKIQPDNLLPVSHDAFGGPGIRDSGLLKKRRLIRYATVAAAREKRSGFMAL